MDINEYPWISIDKHGYPWMYKHPISMIIVRGLMTYELYD